MSVLSLFGTQDVLMMMVLTLQDTTNAMETTLCPTYLAIEEDVQQTLATQLQSWKLAFVSITLFEDVPMMFLEFLLDGTLPSSTVNKIVEEM
jgi:hypothetical protein